MSEVKVSNYAYFDTAKSTTSTAKGKIENARSSIKSESSCIGDASTFMGPAADSAKAGVDYLDGALNSTIEEFASLGTLITQIHEAYKNADTEATGAVDSVTGLSASDGVLSTVKIPDNLVQGAYTVTCYGKDGWHKSAKAQATPVASGTNQEAVHNAWVNSGARYKNGIAVMNINGQDHYLIATTSKLGKVGDRVKVKLKNGQTINCVIADQKSSKDKTYSTYGHKQGGNKVGVLEFEVDRKVFLAKNRSNPTTSGWGLEWDSSSGVSSVDNYGSIIAKT